MLTELLQELRNYFVISNHNGEFRIQNGSIEPLPFLKEGQYFRIIGSVFNDGVHMFGDSDMTDETFSGQVQAMAVPPSVIAIAREREEIKEIISEYVEKQTPYSSESYPNGYSYSSPSALPVYLQEQIRRNKASLSQWRKPGIV